LSNASAWIRWQLPLLSLLAISLLAFFLNYETVSPRVTNQMKSVGMTVHIPQRIESPGRTAERVRDFRASLNQRVDGAKEELGAPVQTLKKLLRFDFTTDVSGSAMPFPVGPATAPAVPVDTPPAASEPPIEAVSGPEFVSAAPLEGVADASGGAAYASDWSRITFYNCVGQGGGFCGRTASGATVTSGVAACGYAYQLGQVIRIVGDPTSGYYTCLDRGGGLGAHQVDVWMYSYTEGIAWQRVVGSYAWVELIG